MLKEKVPGKMLGNIYMGRSESDE